MGMNDNGLALLGCGIQEFPAIKVGNDTSQLRIPREGAYCAIGCNKNVAGAIVRYEFIFLNRSAENNDSVSAQKLFFNAL